MREKRSIELVTEQANAFQPIVLFLVAGLRALAEKSRVERKNKTYCAGALDADVDDVGDGDATEGTFGPCGPGRVTAAGAGPKFCSASVAPLICAPVSIPSWKQ